MTPTRTAGPVIVALVIIIAVSAGILLLGAEILAYLGTLTADTAATVVALLLGALIVAAAVRYAGSASGLRRRRLEYKADAYRRTLALLDRGGREGEGEDPGAVRRDLALWAGSGVLKRFAAIDGMGANADPADPEIRAAIDMLAREMRQDLGQTNLALRHGDLADLAMGRGQGARRGV